VSKPKAPKEDPSTIAMRKQQGVDLAKLDEEENLRIKQLLVGQRGGRFFRGAPALRQAPGNRSGGAGVGVGGAGGAVRTPVYSGRTKGLFEG
jgi:hypothetical protein